MIDDTSGGAGGGTGGGTASSDAALLAGVLGRGRWVDLTVTLGERLPRFPAQIPFQHKVTYWFDEITLPGQTNHDGCHHGGWWLIDEHAGTHLDPPSHWVPPPGTGSERDDAVGEVGVDRVPLEQLHGPACVVDVSGLVGDAGPGASPRIGPGHVVAWEAEHGRLEPGSVVLLASGWDRHYRAGAEGAAWADDVAAGRASGWPAPHPETLVLLHERGVRLVGTDGTSMGAADDGDAAHYAGLSRGMVFVEALTGLDALPVRGAWFWFWPVKVEQASGGPGRAVAFVPGGTA